MVLKYESIIYFVGYISVLIVNNKEKMDEHESSSHEYSSVNDLNETIIGLMTDLI